MTLYAPNTNVDPEALIDQQVADIERYGRPGPQRPPTLFLVGIVLAALFVGLIAIPALGEGNRQGSKETDPQPRIAVSKLSKSEVQWQSLLTREQFRILRRAGTEPAFDNRYHDHKAEGTYACVACGNRLFTSAAKFDSGTGWPSFLKTIDTAAVVEKADNTGPTQRTEVVCSRCDGHLGHVFNDGPKPLGLRYCINSAALTFFSDRTQ